ncbi:MAG: sugar ABC transporter permease [Oscillospiraceae bacterium]|nr:sugar ABC transporter permease [Oscillospiraceae bacterium]
MREKPKRRGVSFQRRGVLTCLLFVSPWLVGAAVFFLYPLFYSLRLSFGVIENPATQKVVFAGFENFRVAFMEDARFFPMLLSIAKDTLINTPLIVVFALFIATLLSKDIRGKGLFRSVFFLPVILGTGFVMQQLLGVQMNADAVEVARGILLPEKVVRFLNPGVTQVILEFLSRVTLVLWKSGVQIIIFLAGLQAIPRSFYEAARVDAATEWECFWFISLPMMAPTLLLGAVYTIVAGFLDTSNEMLGYIHELGFQWSQFEYASAVSWLYFLFVILVLAALFLLLNPATKRVREG